MNQNNIAQYSLSNFKRKRKSNLEQSSYQTDLNPHNRNIESCKLFKMNDENESVSDNSSSTTPLHYASLDHHIKLEDHLAQDDYLSSDGSASIISKKIKLEPSSFHRDFSILQSDYDVKYEDDQDTFRVDMSRFNNFKSCTPKSSFVHTDFGHFDTSRTKIETSSPARVSHGRRNRTQIYKYHRHNKVAVPLVPCKGPACKVQICCAQFCSQSCYLNQIQPIGTGGLRSLVPDYETAPQQEIHVTDYGLPYPDHTYCSDHKNLYFSAAVRVDSPPYCALVEQLFYDEKEQRIRNPRPQPNLNGDPISTNGYLGNGGGNGSGPSNSVKRGRPKRSSVVGLLDPYLFHPSTDVVYTPFLFREGILGADRRGGDLRDVRDAIRHATGLYREVRPDLPAEVVYGGQVPSSGGLSCPADVIDDFFDDDDDDDDDLEEDEDALR